jgi:hypothetical protein
MFISRMHVARGIRLENMRHTKPRKWENLLLTYAEIPETSPIPQKNLDPLDYFYVVPIEIDAERAPDWLDGNDKTA